MTDLQDKPRTKDRRPDEVPHHPKVMAVAVLITGTAMLFMGLLFGQAMTSPGIISQEEAITADQPGDEELSSDRDRAAEDAAAGEEGPAPQAKGGPPEAPGENDPVTPQWELSGWSILSVNGILQVGGTLTNTTNQPLSGTVKVYVYSDGVPVATAKTEVDNFQSGQSEQVNLVSDSEWEAGEKTILLDFQPSKAQAPG